MEFNEKHLEFLQSNISRMNQCSFQMKGWAITIVSALIAVYVATISNGCGGNKLFIFVAIAPTVLFWFLDSFYLSKERKFIGIYNDVIHKEQCNDALKVKDYEMPLNKYKGWRYSVCNAFISPSESILYGLMVIGLILLGVLI